MYPELVLLTDPDGKTGHLPNFPILGTCPHISLITLHLQSFSNSLDQCPISFFHEVEEEAGSEAAVGVRSCTPPAQEEEIMKSMVAAELNIMVGPDHMKDRGLELLRDHGQDHTRRKNPMESITGRPIMTGIDLMRETTMTGVDLVKKDRNTIVKAENSRQ